MISNTGEVAWPKLDQMKAESPPLALILHAVPLHLYDSVRFGLLWTTASILSITSGVRRNGIKSLHVLHNLFMQLPNGAEVNITSLAMLA